MAKMKKTKAAVGAMSTQDDPSLTPPSNSPKKKAAPKGKPSR